jgi:hypothetical protein
MIASSASHDDLLPLPLSVLTPRLWLSLDQGRLTLPAPLLDLLSLFPESRLFSSMSNPLTLTLGRTLFRSTKFLSAHPGY